VQRRSFGLWPTQLCLSETRFIISSGKLSRKEGWEITDDPYVISYGERFLFIDLAARLDALNSHGDIRLDTIFDDTQNRYALMQVGWDRGRRVRGNLIYVTLSEGKVWVEYDGIGQGITKDLIAAGIPPERIVLAFLPEEQTAATA